MRVALGDDAVVIVEGLVDGNEHLDVGVEDIRVRLVIDDFGLVMAFFDIQLAYNADISHGNNGIYVPTTRVSLGSSSKKHLVCFSPM